MSHAKSPEKVVQEIRRKTRRQFSAEEKFRIVLKGLRGEESIAALCRREGLNPNLYYRWSKEFLESGKMRLVGDTTDRTALTSATFGGTGTRSSATTGAHIGLDVPGKADGTLSSSPVAAPIALST